VLENLHGVSGSVAPISARSAWYTEKWLWVLLFAACGAV